MRVEVEAHVLKRTELLAIGRGARAFPLGRSMQMLRFSYFILETLQKGIQ